MKIRIKKKILKRAIRKSENGQVLTKLEKRVFNKKSVQVEEKVVEDTVELKGIFSRCVDKIKKHLGITPKKMEA